MRSTVASNFTFLRTLVTALALVVAAIAGNIIPSIPWAYAHMGDRHVLTHPPAGLIIAVQVGMDSAVIVCLLLLLQWAARASFERLGFRVPPLSTVGVAVLGAAGMFVFVNGLGTLIDTVLHSHHQQLPVEIFRSLRQPGMRAQFAIYAVLLGPAAEELTFRIFLFNAFLRSRNFWIAAFFSSVLFAGIHYDLYAFVPLFIGGLILCAVYARTRNAWAPMITHGLFNLASLAGIYLAPQLAK